jgi:uncharacterized protein YegL
MKKAKAPKKAQKETTIVNFLLDSSGSMQANKDVTIRSFNEYVNSLKNDPKADYRFTLTTFSNIARVEFQDKSIKEVREINAETYKPDGITALFDAIGKTAAGISNDKDKILFVILTDGEENASHEYKIEAIKALIEEKQKKGNWTFTFMGCNIDAYQHAGKFGIAAGNTMTLTSANLDASMQKLSRATRSFAAGGQSATRTFFQN